MSWLLLRLGTIIIRVYDNSFRLRFSIWCYKKIDTCYNAVCLTATDLSSNDCWRCWSGLHMDC